MSFDWKALNGLADAVFEGGLPMHLGRLPEEMSACRDATLLVPLADLAWVKCSGSDAKSFLHNQLTSDINHLATGQWQYSSWCSAKGRMLASFIVVRVDTDSYVLQMAAELVPDTLDRLRKFVLRSEVALQDASTQQIGFGLAGRASAEALSAAALPLPGATNEVALFADGFVLGLAEDRFQVSVTTAAAADLWSRLLMHARPAGLLAWRWLNIRSGIPLVRRATQEEFVPQMVNFDKLGGVSFHKGCYPGQEVVARTQYLGKVKRHLYRGHSDETLTAGVPLFAETDPQLAETDPQLPCGIVAEAAPSPEGGWDALIVMLETAAGGPVRSAKADGRPLSSISPVIV